MKQLSTTVTLLASIFILGPVLASDNTADSTVTITTDSGTITISSINQSNTDIGDSKITD